MLVFIGQIRKNYQIIDKYMIRTDAYYNQKIMILGLLFYEKCV